MDLKGNKEQYYEVSFRIMGDDLEPSSVSSLLGMEPHAAHQKGEENTGISKKGKTIRYSPFGSGIWIINSNINQYKPLKDHLISILDRLESVKEQIFSLQNQGYQMDIYCGYFTSGPQPGFDLDVEIIKRLATLGINFGMNIYVN